MKKAAGFALIKTIPVFLGYIFLGIAFGLLLQKAGLGAGWAFLISLFVYAGSMQFALIGILTERLSFAATAIITLLINSRHAFYGLTFIERFRKMKAAGPYMIFSLTDETYSILCSAKSRIILQTVNGSFRPFLSPFLITVTGWPVRWQEPSSDNFFHLTPQALILP